MEYPCPSLDHIPLPDGAQPIRDRKKPGICLSISPGTSDTSISTDGQLIPFNMADVPLPSTRYSAADTPALSIPLPEEGSNNNNSLSSSSSASSSASSSSKMLVDKLFEDFLSQKIKKPERSTKAQSSSKPVFTNSVEEIKRFLDKEINQLSCKVGFADAGLEQATETVVPLEKDVGDHEEHPGAENSSAVGNQRVTATVPLKIKISDSSVARISSGHLAASSDDQSQSDEMISKFPVLEEESLPTNNAAPSEDLPTSETPTTQCDPILKPADPESNGVADVEAKSSKSSKKHKHKKKKSHKHSKDKNKSTQKLRPHSKKHKSLTKSHSKQKHKSSNSTKSPKKTSKSSHSKSKSSKKSKKTKTKTDSKSKSLTEASETENKSIKKSWTLSTPLENQSIDDRLFGKASALGQIPHPNMALKSPQKDKLNPPIILEPDSTFGSQSRSSPSLECSGKTMKDPEDSLVQMDIGSSPFQPKTLPSKTLLSPPPLPSPPLPSPPPLSESPPPTITPTALVMPVTDSSILQLATVPAKLSVAPLLATEPEVTPVAELPAVSEHSLQQKMQSAVPSCSAPPISLVSHLDPSKQTPPAVPEALESSQISKLSVPVSVSSSLNQPSIQSPAKGLLPVEQPNLPAVETLPSLGMPNTSQETLLNCSQSSSLQTVTPGISVSVEIPRNPTEPSEHDSKVNSSSKMVNKNSVAGQSGLLGLAAYFKSKVRSPSPESKKEKSAKSSSKKSKSSSVSSDELYPRKRSRSTSRSATKKHSSSDKQKRSRPRSKRLRSVSSSRSRSKSRRRQSSKSTKKRARSRSRSRSNDRSRPSAFRSNKRRLSRSRSRSRKKTYGRSRSRSRSRCRNRISARGSSRSRSPSKRATYRQTRSRSRSRSKGRYRHRISSRSNKSRSRSRSRSDIRSRDKRSRSRSTGRHRDSRPSNNKFRRFPRRRSRSRSSSASSSHSRRRRSPIKPDTSLAIDKVKLHDIAVKKLLESGQAPKEEVASLRAGGKTVQGLIDYCKRISQKELESDSGDSTQAALKSDEEEESPFIHHPFRLRESQPNIVLNIKNAKPLPVLTPQEKLIQSSTLRLQFPVSSGSQHRAKESEWVPVPKTSRSSTSVTTDNSVSSTVASSRATTAADSGIASDVSGSVFEAAGAGTNLTATGLQSVESTEDTYNTDSVFPEYTQQSIDISQAMTERMLAVQKLQENPNDVQALNLMYKAQREVNRWAQSKQLPGQFTGSTGAKVMSQEELNGPDKRFQAWAKKEQLQNAAPVSGGIGMHLLQKMGWRQGEGLGKHNEGPTEPITVNVKVDRKGLTSQGEDPKKSLNVEVAGKHPVSALVELCSKCKWGTPMFQQVEEKGPDHKKSFMFKVTVNNVTYQPTMVSNSKKNGRARAAILCLQDIGLLPKNFII